MGIDRAGEGCPCCGDGVLASHVEDNEVTHLGVSGSIKMCFSVCNTCGSELAGYAESVANKEAMKEFRRSVEAV